MKKIKNIISSWILTTAIVASLEGCAAYVDPYGNVVALAPVPYAAEVEVSGTVPYGYTNYYSGPPVIWNNEFLFYNRYHQPFYYPRSSCSSFSGGTRWGCRGPGSSYSRYGHPYYNGRGYEGRGYENRGYWYGK